MFTMIPCAVKSSGSIGSYKDNVLADSPTGFWMLGETSGATAENQVSGAPSGTFSGGFTRNQSSIFNDASVPSVLLDGTSGKALFGVIADYQYNGDFTYEFICKPTIATGQRGLMGHGGRGPYLRGNGSSLNFLKSGTQDRGSGGTLAANAAMIVGFTCSNSGAVKIYKNGVVVFTATVTAADYGVAVRQLIIGADCQITSEVYTDFFQGYVGPFSIYSSELSPGRMLAHAQAAGFA